MTLTVSMLPHLNAALNSVSAILLVLGYRAIRRRDVDSHRRLMLSALAVSALFLTSYVVYHVKVGSVAFTGAGLVRPVYFAILISHIVLAASTVPLALTTLILAARARKTGRFEQHRKWARWTFPIWLYVSLTGVVVYGMLYHLR